MAAVLAVLGSGWSAGYTAAYHQGERAVCLQQLAAASSAWTRATWLSLLEEKVVGASQPAAYKPLVEDA